MPDASLPEPSTMTRSKGRATTSVSSVSANVEMATAWIRAARQGRRREELRRVAAGAAHIARFYLALGRSVFAPAPGFPRGLFPTRGAAPTPS